MFVTISLFCRQRYACIPRLNVKLISSLYSVPLIFNTSMQFFACKSRQLIFLLLPPFYNLGNKIPFTFNILLSFDGAKVVLPVCPCSQLIRKFLLCKRQSRAVLTFNQTLTLADAKVSCFFRPSKAYLPHDDIWLHTGSICHLATFRFLFRVQRYAVKSSYPS